MKRWIIWAMLAAVLLTGCAGESTGEPSTEPDVQTTAPDPGLYVPDSDVQTQTGGAVRQYALQYDDFCTMDFMGADVLLFFNQENDLLATRLTGENCAVAAAGVLPAAADPCETAVRAEGRMLAYYNVSDNSIVYFNEDIQETGRRQLLHTLTTPPVLGKDLYCAYYSVGSEVYAADLRVGIPRLIRQYDGQYPTVLQALFDDSVLLCSVTNPNRAAEQTYISSLTGSPLGTDRAVAHVTTHNNRYLMLRQDGAASEILFGQKEEIPKLLLPKEEGTVHPVISMNGAVVESAQIEGVQLAFYDLSTGKRSSQILLQSMTQVLALSSDDSARYVWIVATDSAGKETLLRWNVAVSAIDDTENYSQQRYSLENPDTEGLAQCQMLADDISKRHGVTVSLVDGVKQPDGYKIEYEYQVKAIEQGLEDLDAVLSKFPEGFFDAMKPVVGGRGIQIGLVRGVSGDSQNTAEPEGLQYWVGGDAYIALCLGENFEKAVLHELNHVLDTYIFANSVLYDEWDEVNPASFRYDENYSDYLDRGESSYLNENNRCFIDAYSMTFAKEDRARVFEYAMTEGNEAVFSSAVMQTKLLRICRAIRDAYGWKKDTRTFPWEQYLHNSLAYVEKK